MQPGKVLPPTYAFYRKIDLSKDRKLLIALNGGSVLLFFFSGWLILNLAAILRPALFLNQFEFTPLGICLFLGAYSLMIVIHELIHGFFFWLFTKEKPSFGFKFLCAYAAAPNWYIPRKPYLVITLAPFVLITFIGLILLPVVPMLFLLPLCSIIAANLAGSIGDLFVFCWLLKQPSSLIVQDFGDAMTIYLPSSN